MKLSLLSFASGMSGSSLPHRRFLGGSYLLPTPRGEEIRAPLKTPAWEASPVVVRETLGKSLLMELRQMTNTFHQPRRLNRTDSFGS